MPVMRSFSSFAGTPDTGGAFVGGAGVGARLVEAGNELALGRERIAAQQAQANMELMAKREALESQKLRQDQELQIQKAYQDATLGLKEQELGQAQQVFNLKAQEAARQFESSQLYQQDAGAAIEGGMDEREAYMKSAMKHGPQMGLPSGAYTQAFKAPPGPGEELGVATDVEGLPNTQYKKFRTGEGSFQLVTLPDSMSAEEVPPGYIKAGKRVLPEREPKQVTDWKKERDRLMKLQDADKAGATVAQKAESGGRVSKSQQGLLDKYTKRGSEIRALEEKIAGGTEEKPAGNQLPEGAKVRSRKTGKMGTVRNGVVVPD